MNRMKKMNLYCIKCQKTIDSSTSLELKFEIDGMTIIYSKCVYCGFEKNAATEVEDLNDGLKKLMVKEKLSYFSFENFDKRLNKKSKLIY